MKNKKRGQTMVEYIIIVVIIAIAAIGIFGVFGDVIRDKLGFGISEMTSDTSARDAALSKSSQDLLKEGTSK